MQTRRQYSAKVSDLLLDMALFLGQSLLEVEQLPVTRIEDLYRSSVFTNWKNSRDQGLKLPGILIGRLDNISKLLVAMAKPPR